MKTDYLSLSKKDLLELARSFYAHFNQVLSRLDEHSLSRRTQYLGWTGKEVLAHMTSAITENFQHLLGLALSGKPIPQPGFNLFLRNASEVHKRKNKTISELKIEFAGEIEKILNKYESRDENDWMKPAWFYVGKVNIRTLFLVQFSDNVFHERDLLLTDGKWNGFNPEFTEPLIDWFMREFRPAHFKPEAANVRLNVLYSLRSSQEKEWTMIIENKTCRTIQGGLNKPDLIIHADVEKLLEIGLARAHPFIGKISRILSLTLPVRKREDFVAAVTGVIKLISGMISGGIKVQGDKRKLRLFNKCFWHFWQRTKQSQNNIR